MFSSSVIVSANFQTLWWFYNASHIICYNKSIFQIFPTILHKIVVGDDHIMKNSP